MQEIDASEVEDPNAEQTPLGTLQKGSIDILGAKVNEPCFGSIHESTFTIHHTAQCTSSGTIHKGRPHKGGEGVLAQKEI